MKAKALVSENMPFTDIHSMMTEQGFSMMGIGESVKYRASLRDSSTESIYYLEIPVERYLEDPDQAKLGKPFLFGDEERIPIPVREAADSKLKEMADYLKNNVVNIDDYRLDMSEPNGSMASDEDEVKQLGKEMESLKTNKEVSEEGEVPDPVQYEVETK
jgi:cell division GTPase FtsZ